LVEAVFEAQVDIVERKYVDTKTAAAEQSVVEIGIGVLLVIGIADIAIGFRKECEWYPGKEFWKEAERYIKGDDLLFQRCFDQGGRHAIDHIILQPAKIIFAVSQPALVDVGLFEGQADLTIEVNTAEPALAHAEIPVVAGFYGKHIDAPGKAQSSFLNRQKGRAACKRVRDIVYVGILQQVTEIDDVLGGGEAVEVPGIEFEYRILHFIVRIPDAEVLPDEEPFSDAEAGACIDVFAGEPGFFMQQDAVR